MGDGRWVEVGPGVLARRYEELDLTVGLVIGEDACLVIDTRGDERQGAELAAAVREVTPHPWAVVLTHAHYDHAHGLAAFLPCEAWAHPGCRAAMAADGEQALPQQLVTDAAELNVGGRPVSLRHFGPAHSDHDLVVHVPDCGVVFAGDLLEHDPGGSFTAESFGFDTSLATWPAAVERILALDPAVVVAGHGEPAGPGFAGLCHDQLATLATLRREVEAGELPREQALARSPLPARVTLAALGLKARSVEP
ncbi:MBL fold metallo-hydrolase [Saccharomonospora amisosensis]|nr:MBL fold metallo-hydrolase [Saccharomonospora amisosensis]